MLNVFGSCSVQSIITVDFFRNAAVPGNTVAYGFYPADTVIGVIGDLLRAVYGFFQPGQIVVVVVGILCTMIPVCALFPILHRSVDQIVIVDSGDAGGRIGDRCQRATVVIAVSDGVPVLKGLFGQPALAIISIVYTIIITVVKGVDRGFSLRGGKLVRCVRGMDKRRFTGW